MGMVALTAKRGKGLSGRRLSPRTHPGTLTPTPLVRWEGLAAPSFPLSSSSARLPPNPTVVIRPAQLPVLFSATSLPKLLCESLPCYKPCWPLAPS